MKNPLPDISVIIPIFNRDKLIEETIDSLLAQNFQNWECIIVDDHSVDNSISIARKYSESDSRFRSYLRPEELKKGANSCRNYGLKMSRGKFIYWLDSDDVIHPNLIDYSLKCLKDPDLDYVRFKRKLFYGTFDKKLIRFENISFGKELITSPLLMEAMLLNEIEYNTCNIVWRKTSLKEEKFCENIVYADEWEYYSRLLATGLKGMNLENNLIFGRKHQYSTTAEFRLESPVRIASKIKAAKMVLGTLHMTNLFTGGLKKYFLRLGFQLRDFEIIQKCLEVSQASHFEKWKYKLGYKIYPVLKPIFYLKGKLKKS